MVRFDPASSILKTAGYLILLTNPVERYQNRYYNSVVSWEEEKE